MRQERFPRGRIGRRRGSPGSRLDSPRGSIITANTSTMSLLINVSSRHKQMLIIMLISATALLLFGAALIFYDPGNAPRSLFPQISIFAGGVLLALALALFLHRLRKAQEALAKEHARLKSIFEAVPVGISWSVPGSTSLLVNSAHVRLSGVSAEESKTPGAFARVTHPDDYRRQLELMEKIKQGAIEGYSLEKRYLHADGRVVWVLFTSRMFPDPATGQMQRVACVIDITERKETEARLQRIEELYRGAIGGAGAVPYSLDYRTKSYLFLGEGIEDLIGYRPEEVNGKLWNSIIQESTMLGEATGVEKEDASQRVLDGRIRTWRCDMRVLTRDGRSRWIFDVSVQNTDESGRVVGSMGILQDITDRKQGEISSAIFSRLGQDLASSSSPKEAARIIGEAADQLLGWDAYRVALYSEEKDLMHGILNFDMEDGKRVEFDPPPAKPPTETARRVLSNGGELILREDPAGSSPDVSPFGNRTLRSASLMYVPMRHGSRLMGILTIQSYTPNAYAEADLATLQELADRCAGAMERIWAEEALRQSETQFRLVWESSGDGMRLADANGIIHAVNAAYCRMVGKTVSELEGQPISVVEVEGRRTRVLDNYRKRVESDSMRSYHEVEVGLWNGRKVWFELSDSRLELADRPLLVLTIFRDITQRKEAEGKLAEVNRKLLEASRQAGMAEIATNVLHNVGNVLNSVNVSANLLWENARQSRVSSLAKVAALFEEHRNDLGAFMVSDRGRHVPVFLSQLAEHLKSEREGFRKEVESLHGNIEHIKEIVAMQQNYARVSGIRELVNVIDLAEDSLRLNAGSLSRHNIEVVREYDKIPPAHVEKHKILQILVNLVRNAKYACDETGRRDKRIIMRVAEGDACIRIAVADNGIGIPAENLTRIFTHGFTTRMDGHGFGLHSGALTAREMGGALTVHSDGPGTGSIFTLTVPLQSPGERNDAGPDEGFRNEPSADRSKKAASPGASYAPKPMTNDSES